MKSKGSRSPVSPYRNLSRNAKTTIEKRKNFSSPSSYRPFLNRIKSDTNRLNGSQKQLSDQEKRLSEEKLLKEVYGIEQRVYNKITKADLLPSLNQDTLKRRLDRPKSQDFGNVDWSPYKPSRNNDFPNGFPERPDSKINKSYEKLIPVAEKERNEMPSEPARSLSQLGNPLRSSIDSRFFHSKNTIRDVVHDPITGEVRKYSVDRSPSRSLGNKNPEMIADSPYTQEITPEKLYSHNRSFSYGDEKLIQKNIDAYSSARGSRIGSPDKSLNNSQNNFMLKPRTPYNPMKFLNSLKVFKGMGYQKSKIF